MTFCGLFNFRVSRRAASSRFRFRDQSRTSELCFLATSIAHIKSAQNQTQRQTAAQDRSAIGRTQHMDIPHAKYGIVVIIGVQTMVRKTAMQSLQDAI